MTDPAPDPWAASCGSGLLIGSGADAWLMLWATHGERGPFHADGMRGAGLASIDRYVGLALYVDGTFDFLTTDRGGSSSRRGSTSADCARA